MASKKHRKKIKERLNEDYEYKPNLRFLSKRPTIEEMIRKGYLYSLKLEMIEIPLMISREVKFSIKDEFSSKLRGIKFLAEQLN